MLNSAIEVEKSKLLKEQSFCRGQFQAVRHAWGHLFNIKETRYHELGYACTGAREWRILDVFNFSGAFPAVGATYKSETELLADLPRFAIYIYGVAC